jgi:hypothetical protein
MPKQKKLKLNELKVKSFVTMSNGQSHQVRGGVHSDTPIPCPPATNTCETPCGSCECPTDPTLCTCYTCETECNTCATCGGGTCPASNCKTCRPWECTLDC